MTKVIGNNELFEQLEAVRETGKVNMLDRRGVEQVANQLELSELVIFIQDGEGREYMELLRAYNKWLEKRTDTIAS